MTALQRLVTAGSALATAGAVHAAINARLLRRPPETGRDGASASVLVPARDEAQRLGPLLASVLAQQPAPAEIVVLDDGSGDATAAVARAVDPRIRVITGRPPPPGWLGKAWALAQASAATDAEMLVLLDADVRLAPDAIGRAVAAMDRHGADLVAPFPRQVAVTAVERLVQPLLAWSWLTFLPLRVAEKSQRPSTLAVAGQFVVLRRSALDAAGGFAAVRGAVLDDLALARAVRASGGRVLLLDGAELASCRMYDGWPGVRDGYGKSLWAAFGSPPRAAALFALLGLAYLLPPLAALTMRSRAGLLGYAAAVAGRVITARRTGSRAWPDALGQPASITLAGWLTARSILGRRRGTLRWKGRRV